MRLPFSFRSAGALLFGLAFSLAVTAQPGLNNVPAAVRSSFAERFGPPAPTPTWDRERGGVWQAVFRGTDGAATSARFDRQGTLLETTRAAAIKELPADARAYVLVHHPNKKIRGAARITQADNSQLWKVSIDGQRLFFDHTGHFLRTAPARGQAIARGPRRGAKRTAAIVADPGNPSPAAPAAAGQAER